MLGPDSALGPMIAAAILPLVGSGGDPAKAIALAGVLALLMGGMCIVAGLARLGVIAELLSKPVRIGYLNGIALVILVGQLPKLFGFGSGRGRVCSTRSTAFVRGVRDGATVPAALVVGLGVARGDSSCAVWWWPKVPGALVAVVGATVAVRVFALTEARRGGDRCDPFRVSRAELPAASGWDDAVTLVGRRRRLGVCDARGHQHALAQPRREARRARRHEWRDRRARRGERRRRTLPGVPGECLGVAHGGGRVELGLGRRSPASSARSVVVVVLVAESDLGRYIPSAVLAAIIIAAAFELFDLATLRWMWRVRRSELRPLDGRPARRGDLRGPRGHRRGDRAVARRVRAPGVATL